ncbi:hypothetical protein M406DRAFT_329135 [Cryphonectria parasitica EP155]|uniref:Uncharacterized protein n=1 Tax=Cryphonectria parasitica (strain ATCC 38755 / EP155) TaxID=660469 RepID=A0A9P5CR18_CRYP1|nr:uncharacterized protein M406DRAFT_329135 [Cryphonectria parasitica EP155]KAF3768094.1 hypothetical protein M406DRAFT_329135 [Cryphonectria parasitica EP155]
MQVETNSGKCKQNILSGFHLGHDSSLLESSGTNGPGLTIKCVAGWDRPSGQPGTTQKDAKKEYEWEASSPCHFVFRFSNELGDKKPVTITLITPVRAQTLSVKRKSPFETLTVHVEPMPLQVGLGFPLKRLQESGFFQGTRKSGHLIHGTTLVHWCPTGFNSLPRESLARITLSPNVLLILAPFRNHTNERACTENMSIRSYRFHYPHPKRYRDR